MNRREFVALTPAFPAATVTASLTLREDGKEPIELDVSVLKCQPGDTLVLRHQGHISMETAERIKRYIEDGFDGRVKAMVLDGGLSLDGVLRA